VLSEECGEGGGGDVGGGEAEDLDHLFARIFVLSKIKERGSLGPDIAGSLKIKGKVCVDGSFEEQETRGSRCIPGYKQQHFEED